MEEKEWFSNKDLYEMVQSLKVDMADVSKELQETRKIVSRYNGLRQQLDECSRKIVEMESKAAGRSSVGQAIREWGGWLVGMISLATALWKVAG